MPENDRMCGKTCIVTGASRGIGFYAAQDLVLKGAHVVLIGHHRGRGERALDRIREAIEVEGHDAGGSAAFSLVDLSVQDQIRDFTASFKGKYEQLDVLVNNAGGFFTERRTSADGIEMTFALNHLNYFMMTNLLLDVLVKTGTQHAQEPARVVNVASDAHRGARMHLDDLQFEEGYSGRKAYNQSKLANVLFTYELDRRLDRDRVTANALHPGFVDTSLGKTHWLASLALSVIHLFFAKSPEKGAQTPIYLASSPEVKGVSGGYFIEKEPARSSPASYDEEAARRLWEISKEMTGL